VKSTKINVKIRFLEKFLGTAPDPEIYQKYIASLAPEGTDTRDEVETLSAIEEKGTTRFHRDENGLFIYNYMIIGFLKEAGNTLKEQLGTKAVKNKVEQFVFCSPRKISLNKSVPDGVFERPKRVNSPMGPVSTLGRSEYIKSETEIKFMLELLDNKDIKPDDLLEILDYGKFKGLGQWRNGGYGAFEVIDFDIVTK